MKSKLYNAYIGELFKTSRKGTFVKLLIALIVVFILVSILFTVISNLYEEVGIQDEIGLIEFQTNDEAIEYYEQLIKDQETYKETVNMIGINDNTLYSYKANLAKYKYLKEHNISPTSVNDFSGQSLSMNANTFVPTIMSIVVTILIIFSITVSYRNYAYEINRGTLKMQLLRPIKRTTVFTAKWLSTYTISCIFLLLFTIIAEIIGVLKFGVSAKSLVVVVNQDNVFLVSPIVQFIVLLINYMFQLYAYIQFTYFVANTVRKGTTASLIISLIMFLIGASIEGGLGYIYIGYLGFAVNMDWVSALTVTGPSMEYMNIYSMLAISLLWAVGMTVFNYYSVKNRDIN